MKNDLIRRGDALKELWYPFDFTRTEIDMNIKHIPAVDAVEVVRCGECKHMTADGRCLEFADDNIRPSASDFCSYGERREENVNSCVCCGAIIPEGRMVCPSCERRADE